MVEEDGALSTVEEYQINSPAEVYTKVGSIIDRFFSQDEFGQDKMGEQGALVNENNNGGGNVFDF